MTVDIELRRVYDGSGAANRYRVLVDRLWPRGVAKKDLPVDVWAKEIAPSPELRTWFSHDPVRWETFGERYQKELQTEEQQARLRTLVESAGGKPITLLYAARDTHHTHAIILRDEMLPIATALSRPHRQEKNG